MNVPSPRTVLLVLSSLSVAFAVGCTSADASDGESTEAALSSCTPAKYAEALASYKNAVAWSKDRLSHGACETDMGYVLTIADEASRAVTACGAFRETIKSSPWAAPVREVLGSSLTMRSLTGELLVIKDSPFQNWAGTERLLAKGVTFWAAGQGAYGSPVQINLRADGAATWGYLNYDEPSGDITWKTMPATYTVTKLDGREQGKRLVTVTHGAVTESFKLLVEDSKGEWDAAPVFTLVPDTQDQATTWTLYSYPSECDA